VDSAGAVYVADTWNDRILKLPAGAASPLELPITGLFRPEGLAIDGSGALYSADSSSNGRVLKVSPGAAPVQLPFSDPYGAHDVAVDGAGNVYVTAAIRISAAEVEGTILELPVGQDTSTTLPRASVRPDAAVTADTTGNVYVADAVDSDSPDQQLRVFKITPTGANTPATLPFSVVCRQPVSIAVDTAGTLYVSTPGQVLKLAVNAPAQTELPIPGVSSFSGVAVDSAGTVYVISGNRVLKLPVR
jgi:serine/threonine-protein kinase